MTPFFTIAIPVSKQPHFLHATLHALVKNSVYAHRILVLYEKREVGAEDFETASPARSDRYASVEAFRKAHQRWLNGSPWTIDFRSVGPACRALRRNADREGRVFEGGTDCAFKNNLGLEETETEWTIPNWDADFYPAPGWDESLVTLARTAAPWTMVVPTHVQPRWPGEPVPPSHRLAMEPSMIVRPTAGRYADQDIPCVTEEAIRAWTRARCQGPREIIIEGCGVRNRVHWVPAALRTKEVLEIGGYSLKGSGYDLEMDDQYAKRGGHKLAPSDSLIVHKAFPPVDCDL